MLRLATLLLLLAASTAQAQPFRDATVVNRSSQPIQQLYVSVATLDDWGNDRLGTALLAPGRSLRVRLGRTRACRYDIRVIYADDRAEEQRDVDVCRTRTYAFDGSGAQAEPAAEPRQVELHNRTPLALAEVYLAPAGSGQWGANRVTEALAAGGQTTLRYTGPCEADLRVVFTNRAAEERRAINVCDRPSVSVAPGWTTTDLSAAAADRMQAAGQLSVVNRSGEAVLSLYLHPDGAAEHGEDRLGADTLAEGARTQLAVARGEECLQTLRVVYEGDTPDRERAGIDVCRSQDVSLGKDSIRAGDFGLFRNAGTVPVVELHVHLAAEPPGQDWLGKTVIGVGSTFELDVPTPGQCLYLVAAQFRDGREAKAGANLCRGEEVVLR